MDDIERLKLLYDVYEEYLDIYARLVKQQVYTDIRYYWFYQNKIVNIKKLIDRFERNKCLNG